MFMAPAHCRSSRFVGFEELTVQVDIGLHGCAVKIFPIRHHEQHMKQNLSLYHFLLQRLMKRALVSDVWRCGSRSGWRYQDTLDFNTCTRRRVSPVVAHALLPTMLFGQMSLQSLWTQHVLCRSLFGGEIILVHH